MPESRPTRATTSLRFRVQDAADAVLRRNDPLVPPRRLRGAEDAAYVAAGDRVMRLLIALAKLGPDDRVLEIGCGAGELARPLSDYLGPGASYDGLDGDVQAIEWCRRAYRDRPDFEFHERGELAVPLPFPGPRFDLVIVTSAFTRLSPDALDQHLREARRVLHPDGRVFASAYLLDDDARAAIAGGAATTTFHNAGAHHALADPADPGSIVAFDEEWFLDRVAECGFKTAGIRHGTWSGRDAGRAHEDIVVARL